MSEDRNDETPASEREPTDEPTDESTDERTPERGDRAKETAWERKRRLATIFGDVLPSTTRDERGDERGEGADRRDDSNDAWLKSQVPPHHGG